MGKIGTGFTLQAGFDSLDIVDGSINDNKYSHITNQVLTVDLSVPAYFAGDINTFTILDALSPRQKKRKRRAQRRNKKRSNGTRRAKRHNYKPVRTEIRGKAYIEGVQIKDKGEFEQHNITFKLTEPMQEYKK